MDNSSSLEKLQRKLQQTCDKKIRRLEVAVEVQGGLVWGFLARAKIVLSGILC